jgi:hypothetical protein
MKFDNLSDISRKDVLGALGLAPRPREYIWPALGLFSTGVLIGAGAALMFAPKSGRKLRAEIRDEFRSRMEDLEQKLGKLGSKKDEDRDQDQDEDQSQSQERSAASAWG